LEVRNMTGPNRPTSDYEYFQGLVTQVLLVSF